MKIGDLVRSERWGLEGNIQDIRPCTGPMCGDPSLTLDPKDNRVKEYYHASSFELVKP